MSVSAFAVKPIADRHILITPNSNTFTSILDQVFKATFDLLKWLVEAHPRTEPFKILQSNLSFHYEKQWLFLVVSDFREVLRYLPDNEEIPKQIAQAITTIPTR